MNRKGQGALEYLLLIGGAVLVAVIVITLLLGIAEQGETDTQATADAGAIKICESRLDVLCDDVTSTAAEITAACNLDTSDTTCP